MARTADEIEAELDKWQLLAEQQETRAADLESQLQALQSQIALQQPANAAEQNQALQALTTKLETLQTQQVKASETIAALETRLTSPNPPNPKPDPKNAATPPGEPAPQPKPAQRQTRHNWL